MKKGCDQQLSKSDH